MPRFRPRHDSRACRSAAIIRSNRRLNAASMRLRSVGRQERSNRGFHHRSLRYPLASGIVGQLPRESGRQAEGVLDAVALAHKSIPSSGSSAARCALARIRSAIRRFLPASSSSRRSSNSNSLRGWRWPAGAISSCSGKFGLAPDHRHRHRVVDLPTLRHPTRQADCLGARAITPSHSSGVGLTGRLFGHRRRLDPFCQSGIGIIARLLRPDRMRACEHHDLVGIGQLHDLALGEQEPGRFRCARPSDGQAMARAGARHNSSSRAVRSRCRAIPKCALRCARHWSRSRPGHDNCRGSHCSVRKPSRSG